MPYIKPQDRTYFEALLEKISYCAINTPGELNYLFTELIKQYYVTHTDSYQVANDIVGALECCKSEFYRRIVAPYEDRKIGENGDVYQV